VTRRRTRIGILATALAALACLAVLSEWRDPVEWTLDGLFYQERVLEIRGADHETAHSQTFEGRIAAELRREDPGHTGNAAWVEYNEPFYERRVAVPLAGAAVYPVAGERSLFYVSLAGYVAAVVALFGLLLLRFRILIAAVVTAATIFLPALTQHSSYAITDSWGLALQIIALGAAIVTLDRGFRWLPLWVAAIALLGFTRDSAWIPVLAAGFMAIRFRTRAPVALFGTGVVAALPALLLFTTPVQNLLAMLVNDFEPSADTSWGFIASNYPSAVVELIRANVGFLRRGEWYTALYLVGGVLTLLLLVWRRPHVRSAATSYMTAATFLALGYVLAAPAFSAFRLELAFVPMAAWGIALATELAVERVRAGNRIPTAGVIGLRRS
jgi:hypothetical protein